MARFKGGVPQKDKVKFMPRNAQNKGGVVGAKKARILAEKKQHLEKKTQEMKRKKTE